jgi:energy-coupling factor transporter ATP-binding protein EcfA2
VEFDGDFFKSQGPPRSQAEIFPTSGFSNALMKTKLDVSRQTGAIRILIGPRGIGKSTCLSYLASHIQVEIGKDFSIVFDAGVQIPDLLRVDSREAAALFFAGLASAISKGSTDKMTKVIEELPKLKGIAFVFIDNLDRLYENENDLELVRYILKTGDPTFKALSEKIVLTFAAAPEWDGLLASGDLSYLNYQNRVVLTPVTVEELEGQLERRAEERRRALTDYVTRDFVRSLYVASNGNPRSAFQLLETVASRAPGGSLPLDGKLFEELVPGELYKGAIEYLRHAGGASPDISWGINQLARFFGALEKTGRRANEGVDIVARAIDGPTPALRASIDYAGVLRYIGHRIDGGDSWELNSQVKKAIKEWRKCGLTVPILLTAFSQNKFISTTTDVQDRADEFRPFLEFDPRTRRRFEESLADYAELEFTQRARWDRRDLIRTAWIANQRLMQCILTIVDKSWDAQLDADLRDPGNFYVASRRLIERTSALYAGTGRHDIHKAELLAIRERVEETAKDPTSLAHWEDYQVDHIQKGAVKAYEAMMRHLHPKSLTSGGRVGIADPGARVRELLSNSDQNHIILAETYGVDSQTGSESSSLLQSQLETVAALMNSDGGVLAIGVKNGEVVGLGKDIRACSPQTRDGVRVAIASHLRENLGPVGASLVRVELVHSAGGEVCLIHVSPAERPVFLKMNTRQIFFRRDDGRNVEFQPVRRPSRWNRKRNR